MSRSIFKKLFGFLTSDTSEIENLASDLARQCRSSLIQRVFYKSHSLPSEQIRGYVRAYANDCLEPVVQQWIKAKAPSTTLVFQVVGRAREFLIEMVVRDLESAATPVMANVANAA